MKKHNRKNKSDRLADFYCDKSNWVKLEIFDKYQLLCIRKSRLEFDRGHIEK